MDAPVEARVYSSLYNELDSVSKTRYQEKLDLLSAAAVDPYALLSSASIFLSSIHQSNGQTCTTTL